MNRYVIMANGKGMRWQNFTDRPKHLLEIDGETLLKRCVRLLCEYDPGCEIIITATDDRYDVDGARRHEPLNNKFEIDRFTYELIDDDVCFLYGDTYYTDAAIEQIVACSGDGLLFLGNTERIIAVKVLDGDVMRKHVDRVKGLFLNGELADCKGWQVYQSFNGLPFGVKVILENYVLIEDGTRDFNYPDDYLKFMCERGEL